MVIIAEVTEKNETKLLGQDTKSKENNIENNAMTSSSSGYSSNRVPLPQLNMMNNNTNMGKKRWDRILFEASLDFCLSYVHLKI